MSDTKSVEQIEKKIKDMQTELKINRLKEELKNKLQEEVEKFPRTQDWLNSYTQDYKDAKSLIRYLNEISEGKHLDNSLITTLVLFETEQFKIIEDYLTHLKIESNELSTSNSSGSTAGNLWSTGSNKSYVRELKDLKEFYLKICAITKCEGDKKDKEKLVTELADSEYYERLLNNTNTKNGVILSMATLLTFQNMTMNDTDIIDLAINDCPRALALIAINEKNCLNKDERMAFFEYSACKGDIVGCVGFVSSALKLFDDLKKECNVFTISRRNDFKTALNVLPIVIELELIFQQKNTLCDDIFDFISEYYDASNIVRTIAAKAVVRILKEPKFNKEILKLAYEFSEKTFVLDSTNTNTSAVLTLLELAETDVNIFVRICEAIHKNKAIPKELTTIIKSIISTN
jgi:hypothetical protein